MQAKIIIAIIGSVTVISLAVILNLVPRPPGVGCNEASALGFGYKSCPQQAPTPIEKTVTPSGDNLAISPPPAPPKDSKSVYDIIKETSGQNQLELNSIVGSWTYVGESHDGFTHFVGTVTFGVNNQFSTIMNLNGYLQPVRYGTYSYSASDNTLVLTYFGLLPIYYTLKDTKENSFTLMGQVDSASFVRI